MPICALPLLKASKFTEMYTFNYIFKFSYNEFQIWIIYFLEKKISELLIITYN